MTFQTLAIDWKNFSPGVVFLGDSVDGASHFLIIPEALSGNRVVERP